MATTSKLFFNALLGMNREQMILYITKFAENDELRVLLYKMDLLRKGCVLAEEANATVEEANRYLKERHVKDNLIALEGRIKMLILSQHMAKNLKDEKKLFSNSQRITELFTEYHMEGGRRSFQSPR